MAHWGVIWDSGVPKKFPVTIADLLKIFPFMNKDAILKGHFSWLKRHFSTQDRREGGGGGRRGWRSGVRAHNGPAKFYSMKKLNAHWGPVQ